MKSEARRREDIESKGDYNYSLNLTEIKRQESVGKKSILRKMQALDSIKSNRLLHDDSILSKLSD